MVATPAITCTRTIAPTQSIASNAVSGGTLCLKPGTYTTGLTISKPRATITSADAANQATIKGRLYIHKGADGVRVAYVHLDGTSVSAGNLPSPTVDANNVRFDHDDVKAPNNIAFIVGSDQYGRADGFVADHNRVHDVGDNAHRSGAGFYDHGFYVQAANNIKIQHNTMWNISGRCVQFYGQSSGSVVSYNTCDNMGVGVIIDKQTTNLLVTRNIFSHATSLGAVARGSSFNGFGDRVVDNWFWSNSRNLYDIPSSGIAASGVHVGDPRYADPAHHNYTLRADSAAKGYGA